MSPYKKCMKENHFNSFSTLKKGQTLFRDLQQTTFQPRSMNQSIIWSSYNEPLSWLSELWLPSSLEVNNLDKFSAMGNLWATIAILATRGWVWSNSEHAHCVENKKCFKQNIVLGV